VLDGGTTFTFVTEGIHAALERARRAAAGRDVALAGGARAAAQYLAAGLVDEMEISLVPTLLGTGERLFEESKTCAVSSWSARSRRRRSRTSGITRR
jgi:dihydrofolate reductase